MWNKMRVFVLSGLILSAPAWADQAQDDGLPDPFDGEWAFEVTPDAFTAGEGQSTFNESVLFHNREFSAAAFAMFGFPPAVYTLSAADNGVIIFTATLSSSDRGSLTWTGRPSANGVVGELVWARPDGNNFRYQLVGVRPQTE